MVFIHTHYLKEQSKVNMALLRTTAATRLHFTMPRLALVGRQLWVCGIAKRNSQIAS